MHWTTLVQHPDQQACVLYTYKTRHNYAIINSKNTNINWEVYTCITASGNVTWYPIDSRLEPGRREVTSRNVYLIFIEFQPLSIRKFGSAGRCRSGLFLKGKTHSTDAWLIYSDSQWAECEAMFFHWESQPLILSALVWKSMPAESCRHQDFDFNPKFPEVGGINISQIILFTLISLSREDVMTESKEALLKLCFSLLWGSSPYCVLVRMLDWRLRGCQFNPTPLNQWGSRAVPDFVTKGQLFAYNVCVVLQVKEARLRWMCRVSTLPFIDLITFNANKTNQPIKQTKIIPIWRNWGGWENNYESIVCLSWVIPFFNQWRGVLNLK